MALVLEEHLVYEVGEVQIGDRTSMFKVYYGTENRAVIAVNPVTESSLKKEIVFSAQKTIELTPIENTTIKLTITNVNDLDSPIELDVLSLKIKQGTASVVYDFKQAGMYELRGNLPYCDGQATKIAITENNETSI